MSANDRIVLRNLTFYGFHGCEEAERQLGQRFVVDLALIVDLERAGVLDDLTQTVDYSTVYRVVRDIVEGNHHYRLIEAVAQRLAEAVLTLGPKTSVTSVWVRVTKPQVPIQGMVVGDVSVEITRP